MLLFLQASKTVALLGHHLPGSEHTDDEAITALRRQLYQDRSPVPPSLSKTLTPANIKIDSAHSKFSDNVQDGDVQGIPMSTGEMRLSDISWYTSGLSNPCTVGMLSDLESGNDNFDTESVFSPGDPPRHILASSSSIENFLDNQPHSKSQEDYQSDFKDVESGTMQPSKEMNSSQESSEHFYDPLLKDVRALLDRDGSPTSLHHFASSDEASPDRTSTGHQSQKCPCGRGTGKEETSPNLRSCDHSDISSPCFTPHPLLRESHHKMTQKLTMYSAQSMVPVHAPAVNSKDESPYVQTPVQSQMEGKSQTSSNTQSTYHNLHTPRESECLSSINLKQFHLYSSLKDFDSDFGELETQAAAEDMEVKLSDESDSEKTGSFKTLYSSRFKHGRTRHHGPTNENPPVRPVEVLVGVEQATDEEVTTFDYESDDSEYTPLVPQPTCDACLGDSSNEPTSVVANPQDTSSSHSTSVSPWHDKNRKIRINPLRVLKVAQISPLLPTPPEQSLANRARIISPEDIAKVKVCDKLRRSKSFGPIEKTKSKSAVSLNTVAEAADALSFSHTVEMTELSQMDLDLIHTKKESV